MELSGQKNSSSEKSSGAESGCKIVGRQPLACTLTNAISASEKMEPAQSVLCILFFLARSKKPSSFFRYPAPHLIAPSAAANRDLLPSSAIEGGGRYRGKKEVQQEQRNTLWNRRQTATCYYIKIGMEEPNLGPTRFPFSPKRNCSRRNFQSSASLRWQKRKESQGAIRFRPCFPFPPCPPSGK